MSKSLVLYDGGCYLCNQSKRLFKRFDWFNTMEWISLQQYGKVNSLPKSREKAIKQELHVLLPSGDEKRGYFAITYLMRKCPLTFIPGVLFSIPGSSIIGKPLYAFVARSRYKLFKGKCKNGSCSLPKS
ncbi:thiol-disulfide oxidoreductase DCC family protein [Halobacillus mangrovi]|uniref:thiol-disulfide oxidoreductase DCC family protein n=1 Tax=Halobacillus mangrovi TaxID=402384 RepID=UPI003D96AC69